MLRRVASAMESLAERVLCDGGSAERQLVEDGRLKLNQAVADDLPNTMIAIIVTAISGFVGLTALNVTEQATGVASGEFAAASDALVSGVNSAFSLVEVAFLTAILGAALGMLVGMRRGGPDGLR